MQTLDIIKNGVTRADGLITSSINISNRQLIQRVPINLPEQYRHYNHCQSKCNIADEFAEGD